MTNAGVLTLFDAKDHKYDNSTARDPLPISLFLFLYTKIVKTCKFGHFKSSA